MTDFGHEYYAHVQRYQSSPFWMYEAGMVMQALREYAKGGEVLDFGGSDGTLAAMLLLHGLAHKVYVVDQNQFAIERGRQKYPDVEFLDGFNGWISPFRDPVDAVVMLNSLGHVGNVEEVLREVQEALSETGVLIISCSNLRHYWLHDIQRGSTDPTLVHEFTPGSLRLALEEHDFTVVRQRCYGRRLFGVGPCARMLTVAMKTWRSDEERIGVSAAS